MALCFYFKSIYFKYNVFLFRVFVFSMRKTHFILISITTANKSASIFFFMNSDFSLSFCHNFLKQKYNQLLVNENLVFKMREITLEENFLK